MSDRENVKLPMPILTPRLRIAPPRVEDGPVLNAAVMSNIESIAQWMPWANPAPSVNDTNEYLKIAVGEYEERKVLALLIWDRNTGELIGSAGFHDVHWEIPSFETGYWIRKESEGKGYIQEAVNALTRYAFLELKAKRLAIQCDKDNLRSRAIPDRLGFDLEGLLRRNALKVASQEVRDTLVFSRIGLEGLPALDVRW